MLCFSFLTWFWCWKKELYRHEKTAPTDPTQTPLVWFGSDFIFKVNRTKPHDFLSCGSDDFYPQIRTKLHREHPYI